jgi:hypothetical protein
MKISKLCVPMKSPPWQDGIPVVAIDLSGAYTHERTPLKTGYAQSPIRGLGADSRNVSQTEAVNRTCDYFAKAAKSHDQGHLILEAPLSYAFKGAHDSTERLNAVRRHPEFQGSYPTLQSEIKHDRPWIQGCGAVVSLVALLTLRHLLEGLDSKIRINLYEGFYSWFKPSASHASVAKDLLAGFEASGHRVISLPQGVGFYYRTALQLLEIDCEGAGQPPLIVFGSQKLARAYKPPTPGKG